VEGMTENDMAKKEQQIGQVKDKLRHET